MITTRRRRLDPDAQPHQAGYIPIGGAPERSPWDVPCVRCGSPAGWLCVDRRQRGQRSIARQPCDERWFASRRAGS